MTGCQTHPQYRAMLAAVCATPKDDLPRLVLADWLEEHGETERAEFIRVQCEMAKHPTCLEPGHACDRCAELRRFERWWIETNRQSLQAEYKPFLVGLLRQDWDDVDSGLLFARGFVAEVRCTLADWCGGACSHSAYGARCSYGVIPLGDASFSCPACRGTGRTAGIRPRLVREHPVERVVLTDREPHHSSDRRVPPYAWFRGPAPAGSPMWRPPHDREVIPVNIYDLIAGYSFGGDRDLAHKEFPTREAAEAAMSAALIAWAKSSHPQEVLK